MLCLPLKKSLNPPAYYAYSSSSSTRLQFHFCLDGDIFIEGQSVARNLP